MDLSPRESTDGSLAPEDLLQRGYRYALSLSHHPQDAEDLLQEAWVRLARRYAQPPTLALLFVTIRNAYFDLLRRRAARPSVPWEEVDLEAPASPPTSHAPDDLAALLGTLNPREREALFLHHVEGRTAEEIGALTHTPRNTVLSLIHRGLKKLQSLPNL